MLRSRTRPERAARSARIADKLATWRALGVSELLATPMTKARRTPIGRRKEPRRSSFFKVPDYYAHLKAHPCAFCRWFALPCSEPIEVHHQREGGGVGLRRPDTQGVATCPAMHKHRHRGTGPFGPLSRSERNLVERAVIAGLQAAWFGRALDETDLPTVRAAVEAKRDTRGLFAATNPIPAAEGRSERT